MNSGKSYKRNKMKYEIMNIKVEVNMMKAVIIKQLKDYTIISINHNHNNSNNDN